MVPLKGIQKAHPRMAYSGIHQLIYSSHKERILGASFIQICEVHTHPPLPILLLHYHCISQPVRVDNFLNSPSLLKLVHLFLDSIRMLLRLVPRWLLPREDNRVDIEMMAYKVWIYPEAS